jgi:hypothetical protein
MSPAEAHLAFRSPSPDDETRAAGIDALVDTPIVA